MGRSKSNRSSPEGMSRRDRRALLREVALVAERGFRRGFQQGYLAALGELGGTAPTHEQVWRWRFAAHSGTHSVWPPGSRQPGVRQPLLDRLGCELCGLDLLQQLLYEAETKKED